MTTDTFISIAIDGPNGSGKSTIAKMLAKKLGIIYIDTGAMYRAVALYLKEKGVSPDNEQQIKQALKRLEINIRYIDGTQRVFISDEDVTDKLRSREISELASQFATNPLVREKLVMQQRLLASCTSVVMDGRDIGTSVLPDATLKVYLDADIDIRTSRRLKEYGEAGAVFDTIKQEIARRDERDISREHSPLTKAADAILIDSSEMSPEQVMDTIINRLKTEEHKCFIPSLGY